MRIWLNAIAGGKSRLIITTTVWSLYKVKMRRFCGNRRVNNLKSNYSLKKQAEECLEELATFDTQALKGMTVSNKRSLFAFATNI